jgi:hypothetical protein
VVVIFTDAAQLSDIKAKTDNLPSDPADESVLVAAITAATKRFEQKFSARRKQLEKQQKPLCVQVLQPRRGHWRQNHERAIEICHELLAHTLRRWE